MLNRFAGAQDLRARRRRSLARNEVEDVSKLDQEILAEFSIHPLPRTEQTDDGHPGIIAHVIPRHLWAHALLLAATAGLVSFLLLFAPQTTLEGHTSQISFAPLSRQIAGFLFLVAGQLAMIVAYQRSLSELDYRGRYRVWKWLSLFLIVGGFLVTTNLHVYVPVFASSSVEYFTGPIHSAKKTLTLIPLLLTFVAILRFVMPDMGNSRFAQVMFAGAILTAVVRKMLLSTTPDESGPQTASILLASTGFLTFASMLLHARFVTYVSNDPPSAKPEATSSKPPEQTVATDEPAPQTIVVAEPQAVPEPSSVADTASAGASKAGSSSKKNRRAGARKRRKAA